MNVLKICARLLEKVREQSPLVHHLTNYVTVNDCANVTLAIGGSPIMAEEVEEVADIAAISSALVINIGTLNTRTVTSMLAAGKSANAKGVPVVLDPVGAGASSLRTRTAARLLNEVQMAAVRGNISEIRSVGGFVSHTKGVDAGSGDEDADAGAIAAEVATKLRCVVAITGARDAVSDGEKTLFINNGVAALARVSGTGCMCSSLVGAFTGVEPERALEGAVAAIVCMGIAGEIAFERVGALGTGSFRVAVMDAISLMDGEMMARMGRVDETTN